MNGENQIFFCSDKRCLRCKWYYFMDVPLSKNKASYLNRSYVPIIIRIAPKINNPTLIPLLKKYDGNPKNIIVINPKIRQIFEKESLLLISNFADHFDILIQPTIKTDLFLKHL